MGANIGMKGLRLQPNHFTVERGACIVADNCVIPSKDVIEPRRGIPKLGYAFGSSTHRARAVHMFQSKLLVWRDTGNALAYDTGSGFTDLSGTYSPPDATTLAMKFADMAKSTYFTTTLGPYALAAYNGTPRAAGLPRPKDFYFVANNVASGGVRLTNNPDAGWMTKNTSVGYRAVIGLLDANSVVHLSAPSGRVVVNNPADVNVAIGSLVRTGGNTVTATVASPPGHGFRAGDVVKMTSAGEANFANGNKTLTAVTATTFVYTEAGANASSTVQQTFSSGAKDVQVVALIPSGLTAGSHFVQLYRTRMSAAAGTDPKDELYQVYERFITATDISNGYVTITDTCPESAFQGAPLYTNAVSGQGSAQANNQPPIANDIAVWDNRLWFAQTIDRHRLTFRILGIGSPNGLQTGDVICLGPNAFKAGTDFQLFSEYSASQNVSLTVAQLIYQHNTFSLQTPTSLCYALEDGTVYPASILFEEISIGGATTYAACSRTSAVAERLPSVTQVTVASTSRTTNVVTVRAPSHGFSSGQNVMLATSFPDANFPTGLKTNITVIDANNFSYAESGANAVMTGTYYVYLASYPSSNNKLPLRYSKQLEPEACPLFNYPVGLPDNADVARIMPLRDKLYVFLKNADIYTVSGSWPYQVVKFDDTASLVAPDTLVGHAGRLYALTTQGVVAVSDGGVEVLSYDIEPELNLRIANMIANGWARYAFAVSYEGERQYQLWLPTASGAASKALVYNSLLREWTSWTLSTSCGLVNPVTGKLTLGAGDSNTLRLENKSLLRGDFQDGHVSDNANSANPSLRTVQLDSSSLMQVGDVFDTAPYLGAAGTSKRFVAITAVNVGTGEVTLENTTDAQAFMGYINALAPIGVEVYRPFICTVTPVPDFAGVADAEKQWRESKFHFPFFDVQSPIVSYTTEQQTTAKTAVPSSGAWPSYGGASEASGLPPVVFRTDVPEECERAVLLYPSLIISEPLALWRLGGMTTSGEPTSERTGQ